MLHGLQGVDTKSIRITAEDRDILMVCPVLSNRMFSLLHEKVQA